MMDFDSRIEALEIRNTRVEADKSWETSWARRGLIAFITYFCAIILLNILGHDGAWKHAFVPVMGYVLSTLSLPPVKKMWIEKQLKMKSQR
jgi:hypothetical protein